MSRSDHLVLLAEDDRDIALLLTEALELEGYTVVLARHGRHALALLDVCQPAVLLTDLMMPEMDGLALLRALQGRPGPRPRVLAMSAFDTYLQSALELGADGALPKPFDLDLLLKQVNALAQGRPAAQVPRSIPLDERQRLRAILEMQLDQPSPSEALQHFAVRTARIFDVPVCLVSIVTRDRQYWHSHCGLPEDLAAQRGTPREDSFCTHAVSAGAALVVIDTHENPFFSRNVLVRDRGLRFYAGVPLIYRRGEPLGTLCLLDFVPRSFSAFDLELLAVLSRRVIAELEWRERRMRPGIPASAFRHLAWLDEELDTLGREAFEQALQVESLRAAERRNPLSLAVLEVPPESLAAVSEELKQRFPRSHLGRLGTARVGLLVPDVEAAEVHDRARAAAGDGARVETAPVPRIVGAATAFLSAAERCVDAARAPGSTTGVAG